MQSYLEEILGEVLKEKYPLSETIFILPSKRAGTFLKKTIAEKNLSTGFAPQVFSIENFVEKIAGLAYAQPVEQLFTLYTAYKEITPTNPESFSSFSNWARTILQDFNEIDRYLIAPKKLFPNLSAIQEVSHWSVTQPTKMVQDYLKFWKNLEPLYTQFTQLLLAKNCGHQGLIYRIAREKVTEYLNANANQKHVFIGFNAMNAAESSIIQQILEQSQNEIFWDIDAYFLNDNIHDAGLFIRQHKKTWPYFQNKELKGISTHYSTEKNIYLTGVPKLVSQAKFVGALLKQILAKNPSSLKKTAVVLADETLLNPILHAIPEEVEALNITMGYPLQKTPVADLFEEFIGLYVHQVPQGWYHKRILSFVGHPYIKEVLTQNGISGTDQISNAVKTNNWAYVSVNKLKLILQPDSAGHLLFFEKQPTPAQFVHRCLELIQLLKNRFDSHKNALALEYLYHFHTLFNQISKLLVKHTFITEMKALQDLFSQLLQSYTIDFQGDPLEGLQIMGMLESRNLDFETVIITSVNEGILPSGKSNNSFIPFDLKLSFGLPTYKEKDAVYTYHFYRLLQRAKNIHIIYNTEVDVLEGGEKSRLIAQLLTDTSKKGQIVHTIASPVVNTDKKELQRIDKNLELFALIKLYASKGFSPTSLTNYIQNPMGFYKKTLLGIEDPLEVEEYVAANTFGTILHDTLEELYTPFIGQVLSEDPLKKLKPHIQPTVQKYFNKYYGKDTATYGKNLIAFHVLVRNIENFIDREIEISLKHEIKIIALEQKSKVTLDLPELDFPVVLKGKLDRIDSIDGVLRIIDYKTGKVENKNVEIIDFHEVIEYEYSKAFQLLCYAMMYQLENSAVDMMAGNISFKNLNSGVLLFAIKDKRGPGAKKDHWITPVVLEGFSGMLKKLIIEICDPETPFLEKEPVLSTY